MKSEDFRACLDIIGNCGAETASAVDQTPRDVNIQGAIIFGSVVIDRSILALAQVLLHAAGVD